MCSPSLQDTPAHTAQNGAWSATKIIFRMSLDTPQTCREQGRKQCFLTFPSLYIMLCGCNLLQHLDWSRLRPLFCGQHRDRHHVVEPCLHTCGEIYIHRNVNEKYKGNVLC
jgi:hypothetical protein